jgi:hypothetical protein
MSEGEYSARRVEPLVNCVSWPLPALPLAVLPGVRQVLFS